MFIAFLLFLFGFFFLIKGAGTLVDGSASIAKKFGVPTFFIGLTIVAFGTSTPELVVNLIANLEGDFGIVLGSIIGSNISNTLLILGVAAIIKPLIVKRSIVNREIPFSLLVIFAVAILSNDSLIVNSEKNILNRMDGLILILLFGIFIYYTFIASRDDESIIRKAVDNFKNGTEEYGVLRSVLMVVLGIFALIIGGKFMVDSAIVFANSLGVDETVIGLTIVAIGTSLPELAASAMAAKKGETDMAIGNVVGSNIFNFLLVLGLSSMVNPIKYNTYLNMDMVFLTIITISLMLLVYIGKKNILARKEGVILIFLYIVYITFLAHRQMILGISG